MSLPRAALSKRCERHFRSTQNLVERKGFSVKKGEQNRLTLYGKRAVAEVLAHCPSRIMATFATMAVAKEFSGKGTPLPKWVETNHDMLDELSEGGVHQGVVLEISPLGELSLQELAKLAKESRSAIVLLDEVTDPHNLGAILRACEGSGVAGVVVGERRSATLTPAARKTSAGASELVPLVTVVNLVRAIESLRKEGFWIAGLALEERSKPIHDYEFGEPLALVFGSEGRGLRRLTSESCDDLVKIPMYGLLDSLNVSQAVAVTLFEWRRRRGSP
jgi:23S rRNA (guanosine2251-2'-O)-methyltransferase